MDPDAAEKTAVLKAYEGMSATELEMYATGKLGVGFILSFAHRG
ncbi:hypothetical protein [Streptomyces globisporus]|nr:hypothetical protein OG449_34555 [Streptomyces globisporus]